MARELPVALVDLFEPYKALLVAMAAAIVPMAVVLAVLVGIRWQTARLQRRMPRSERLLRRPGQSLQEEIQLLWDALPVNMAALAMSGAALGAIIGTSPSLDVSTFSTGQWGTISLVGIISAVAALRSVRLMRAIATLRTQMAACRAVAEELQQLVTEGCRVYHDVPSGTSEFVDHVLIAPCGVFVIETRYYPKRPGGTEELQFDGMQLMLPDRTETRPFVGLHKASVWLNSHVTEVTGSGVPVGTILVLPGWNVLSRTRDSSRVMGPQQIATLIRSKPPTLSGPQFKRISETLDDRCRTEAF